MLNLFANFEHELPTVLGVDKIVLLSTLSPVLIVDFYSSYFPTISFDDKEVLGYFYADKCFFISYGLIL